MTKVASGLAPTAEAGGASLLVGQCKSSLHQGSLCPWSPKLQGGHAVQGRYSPLGEWRLHPQMVQLIWSLFREAEIDLFASEENTRCLLFFSLTPSPPVMNTIAEARVPFTRCLNAHKMEGVCGLVQDA